MNTRESSGLLLAAARKSPSTPANCLNVAAAAIFENEFEAARVTDAGNGRRIEEKDIRLLDAGPHFVEARRQSGGAVAGSLALGPGLQFRKDGGGVGRVGAGQYVQSGDGKGILNFGLGAHLFDEGIGHRLGTLHRGAQAAA